MRIRPATADDLPFLTDMLLVAFDWRGDQQFTAARLADDDHARRYVEHWPRPGDLGVVALDDETGEPVGAAWARLLPADRRGYGYVADDVPELGLGVAAEHRGRGVGRALMEALIEAARAAEHDRLSLSVEPDNRAANLYRSLGFREVGRVGGSDTMLLTLRDPAGRDS